MCKMSKKGYYISESVQRSPTCVDAAMAVLSDKGGKLDGLREDNFHDENRYKSTTSS